MSGLGDFGLTADQQMIRDAAASFLAEASSSAKVRRAMESESGTDLDLWARIGQEMGWCATHVPEAYGGLGLGWVELTLILEETGRRLVCAPFFSTVALATNALLECGSEAARQKWLPDIAAGTLSATLAFGERGIDWSPEHVTASARTTHDGFVLEGEFRHVPDGASVDCLFLPARLDNGAIALFAVKTDLPGVDRRNHSGFDATRRVAQVSLADVHLSPDALVAKGAEAEEGLARTAALAAISLAAEQLGGAQHCLEMALAYSAERVQFGRTINGYQAVKHRCAEMMIRIEATRSAVAGAARLADLRPATAVLLLEAACAKAFASETFPVLRRGVHPVAWWRGLHLGIRPPPLLQARTGRVPVVGFSRCNARARGRSPAR